MANTDDELAKYKNQLEQLKRVQEAGKVGYWAISIEDQFLEWSAETYKMFDLPNGQPITYEDMLTYVHPEDKDWVDERWQLATKNGKYAVVYRIITAQYKVRWIETFGDVVFDADNNFVSALGIVRDITQQKEAEIKMATLAASLKRSQKIGQLGSWVVKAPSPLIEMNEEAKLMFNFNINQAVKIDDWLAIIHPDDHDYVKESWTKTITGKSGYDLEYRIVVNNATKWIKAVGEMEFDSAGVFIQTVGVVKDISDYMMQQENLRLAKDQAEVANKLKSQFLANMSHEIRTPLNGIIGFSEVLLKTSLDATQQHYLTTVNQSALNLIDIINDILDFSKIEAGKLELSEDKVDLFELINQVKDLMSDQAQKKNIDLWVKTGFDVPRFVIADGLRLQQVLINLMSNAVKFTKDGEIELSIQLLAEDFKKPNTIRFSVLDSGLGISDEHQSKIFEAFTQADLSTTKKYGGTGLGLSISNGILSLMHSKLQLESQLGEGSRFYFDVALKHYQTDTDHSKIVSPVKQDLDKDAIDERLKSLSLKILVVDDNEINIFLNQTLIHDILPKAIILEAENGEMAIEIFEKEKPDLILMDIQMPVMNGYDATKLIREIECNGHKHTPIIALTAGIMPGEKEKCLGAGTDDFMAKPILAKTFSTMIKRWIPA